MSTHTTQPRQPRGVPIGGRWREDERPVGAVDLLTQGFGRREEIVSLRRRALIDSGQFVPAAATIAHSSAKDTSGRTDWWETHFAQGEYNSATSFPQMPDDYTPAHTGGQALSGHRRTHRMRYDVGGLTLRMPSRTALSRYCEELRGATFDVPLSVDLPGGTVQGWVRVTRGAEHRWDTQALGFPDGAADAVSEAVAATLERRRAGLGPQAYGDLIERRRQRLASQGIEVQEVTSGWISAVGYDADAGVMAWTSGQGKIYGHQISPEAFEEFRRGASPGRAYWKHIRGRGGDGTEAPRAVIDRCPECGRYTVAGRTHTCPVPQRAWSGPDAHRDRVLAHLGRALPDQTTPTADDEPPRADGWSFAAAMNRAAAGHVRPRSGRTRYGRAGWTDRLALALVGTTGPDKVHQAWRGNRSNGDAGSVAFAGVDAPRARVLLSRIPEAAAGERQGNGPSLGTALQAAVDHPDRVYLSGFVVGGDRSDERVTADSVTLCDPDLVGADAREVLFAARDRYGITDATARPDSLRWVPTPWRGEGSGGWQLTWD